MGGTGGVAAAIASSAVSNGAEIRVNAPVAQIIVKKGTAVGVALENGDEIYADTVVSGCDPKVTFRKLVEEKELPADLVERIDIMCFPGGAMVGSIMLGTSISITGLFENAPYFASS